MKPNSSEVAEDKEKKKLHFKTIFISDVHLGMPDSKSLQAAHFLRHCSCDKLVLNGDIIDVWHLRRLGGWNNAHTHFVRTVLRKMEKEGAQIIYLRGNHDDILDQFIPVRFGDFVITDEYIHNTSEGNYLVVHGDGFDAITTNYAWLAKLGGHGYNFLLRVNRVYNIWRSWRGLPPFSFSAWVKMRVKSAVGAAGKYEDQLRSLARQRRCKGIICGHIHKADDKIIGDTHYLNSGDWVESMTAVVELPSGGFRIIGYPEFCQLTHRTPK